MLKLNNGWTLHEATLLLEDDPSNGYRAVRWVANAIHSDGRTIGWIGRPEDGPDYVEQNLLRHVFGYSR